MFESIVDYKGQQMCWNIHWSQFSVIVNIYHRYFVITFFFLPWENDQLKGFGKHLFQTLNFNAKLIELGKRMEFFSILWYWRYLVSYTWVIIVNFPNFSIASPEKSCDFLHWEGEGLQNFQTYTTCINFDGKVSALSFRLV